MNKLNRIGTLAYKIFLLFYVCYSNFKVIEQKTPPALLFTNQRTAKQTNNNLKRSDLCIRS